MANLTKRESEALGQLLSGEELACKKARIYANTLTDVALAGEMARIGEGHYERFCALLALIGGKA